VTITTAEQVADHHRSIAGQLPAEVADAFAAEQRELGAGDAQVPQAAPRDRMQEGSLLDVAGRPTTLAAALSSRPSFQAIAQTIA